MGTRAKVREAIEKAIKDDKLFRFSFSAKETKYVIFSGLEYAGICILTHKDDSPLKIEWAEIQYAPTQ